VPDEIDLNMQDVASACDEWMRRYIEEPERFGREWQTVKQHLDEAASGKEHTYGKRCARYLVQLVAESRCPPVPA